MLITWRAKKANLNLTPAQRAAIYDGNAWASMVGFGETYLSPCGIFLKGSNLQLSLLTSLPPLLGALSQVFSLWLLQFIKSRRRLVGVSVFVHANLWLLAALLPVLLAPGAGTVWGLIAIATLCQISGNVGSPAWNSLMGDTVPANMRGRYFGLRNFSMGFCTFLAIMIGGQVLDETTHIQATATGFFAVFLAAGISRLISFFWTQRYDDVAHETGHKKHYFSFWQFMRRSPKSNFAKFVLYGSIVNGAVAFSGPFFTVYMLNHLHFTYTEFTVITVTNTVVQFLVMQYWGKLADAFGNKNIINLLGYGVAISPMLWIFSDSFVFLMLVQMYSGFVWAGFNLASANFLFDAVTPAKRARCTAYQAVVNGCLVFAGAMIGGVVVDLLPAGIAIGEFVWLPSSPLMFMFALSGVIRCIAASIFLPRIKDTGDRKPVKHYELLFQISRLRPMSGVSFDVVGSKPRK